MSFALFTSRKKRKEALRENSGARERRQNLDTSIGWLLLLQVVLIALNAVFACAEIAVLSVNEVKLSKMVSEGSRKARRLSRLTAQPARFLATIQVAITLAGFLGSAFAAENFSDPLVDWLVALGVTIPPATLNTLAVILITLILSFFTLVFGELVPKRIAMKQSEKVALNISGLITVISKLFAPIVWLLSASTNGILRLLGIDPNEAEEQVGDLGSDDSNIPDDDEPRIEKREDGSLVITGNVELDDLEDALGIELDQEEHDTLTGLVFDALGMIPDDGPQDITLEAEGMRIHVTSILDHQVNAAEVTLLPQTEDADEAKE